MLYVAIIFTNEYGLVLGERLQIEIEEHNNHDARAVAVQKGGILVGHLPREAA